MIRNFRNFKHLDLPIAPGVTCFIGENNTGKTNLLHAVRLALDANMSNYRRRLLPEDFATGVSFKQAEQILVAVEFADFADDELQEALLFNSRTSTTNARITYRFRPRKSVRDAFLTEEATQPELTLNDYQWELRGGGQADPAELQWHDDNGEFVRIDHLSDAYSVVMLGALRDAEQIISRSRRSPLRQLLTSEDVPEDEQENLVTLLEDSNRQIAESATIREVATSISTSLSGTVGPTFPMKVELGMAPPTFDDITNSLNLLLSNPKGLAKFSPRLNGLGMNNLLYASMLLQYFDKESKNVRQQANSFSSRSPRHTSIPSYREFSLVD